MGIPLQSTSSVMNPTLSFTFVVIWSFGGFLGVAGYSVPEVYQPQQGYGTHRTCEDVLEVITQEISSYQAGDRSQRQAMHCRCNGRVDANGDGECQTRKNSGGSDGRGGTWCYVENTRFMRQQCGDFAQNNDGWISFLACL